MNSFNCKLNGIGNKHPILRMTIPSLDLILRYSILMNDTFISVPLPLPCITPTNIALDPKKNILEKIIYSLRSNGRKPLHSVELDMISIFIHTVYSLCNTLYIHYPDYDLFNIYNTYSIIIDRQTKTCTINYRNLSKPDILSTNDKLSINNDIKNTIDSILIHKNDEAYNLIESIINQHI